MEQLNIGKNDYGMNWAFTVTESDGATAVDLTDYTVTINIWTPGDTTALLVSGGSCSQDSPTDGTCHWTVTDVFNVKSVYYAELQLAKTGVIESTEIFLINVKESP